MPIQLDLIFSNAGVVVKASMPAEGRGWEAIAAVDEIAADDRVNFVCKYINRGVALRQILSPAQTSAVLPNVRSSAFSASERSKTCDVTANRSASVTTIVIYVAQSLLVSFAYR